MSIITPARYFRVTKPFRLYVQTGTCESNTYFGASQTHGNVWTEIKAEPGGELHLLPGGDFYVTLGYAWRCVVELDKKHPFEKVYVPREQPWPLDSLEPTDEHAIFHRLDTRKTEYTMEQLKKAGASKVGRNIDYVIPPVVCEPRNYIVTADVEMTDMESPLDAARAMAKWLIAVDRSSGVPNALQAFYYVCPVVDDGRIAKEVGIAVDLQNPKDSDTLSWDEQLALDSGRPTLEEAARQAAAEVALGGGDELVVLPFGTEMPGAQHDDGVTAIAAIDLLRVLVDQYEQPAVD